MRMLMLTQVVSASQKLLLQCGRLSVLEAGLRETITHVAVAAATATAHQPIASATLAPEPPGGRRNGSARSRLSHKPPERMAAIPMIRRPRRQPGVERIRNPRMSSRRMPDVSKKPQRNEINGVGVMAAPLPSKQAHSRFRRDSFRRANWPAQSFQAG